MHIWGRSIGIHRSNSKDNTKTDDEGPSVESLATYRRPHRSSRESIRNSTTSSMTNSNDITIGSSKNNSSQEEWSTGSTLDRRHRIRQRTHHHHASSSSATAASSPSITATSSDEEAPSAVGSLSFLATDASNNHPSKQRRAGSTSHHRQSLVSNISVSNCQKRFWICLSYCADPNNWKRAWIWCQKNRRLVYCILFAIPFILRPSRIWKWRYDYFGKHNNHGGQFGQRIEKWGYLQRFDQVQAKQQHLLDSLGIVLPPGVPTDRSSFSVLKLDSQAAIRELLVRREERAHRLSHLEQHANASFRACVKNHPPRVSSPNSTVSLKDTVREQVGKLEIHNTTSCTIPSVIFVPDEKFGWQAPRPGKSKRYQQLLFDELEMRQVIKDTRPGLSPLFDSSVYNDVDRINLWAVCSIYYFGGVFVGDSGRSDAQLLQDLLWKEHAPILSQTLGGRPAAVAIVDDTQHIQLLAATPRHPALLCMLKQWESMMRAKHLDTLDADASGFVRYDPLLADWFLPGHAGESGWTRATLARQRTTHGDRQTRAFSCSYETEPVTALNWNHASQSITAEINILRVAGSGERPSPSSAITVKLSEESSNVPAHRTEKVTLESQLKEQRLEPGWFCMRCIKIPQYGRMERCTRFCPAGYSELVCNGPDIPEKKPVHIQVQVGGHGPDFQSGTAIPKLIHQTWFEDVTLDRYPQLARLQNSWKNTGWKYQLYTDETARAYILDHFPSRFVDAFDALIPGAFKADLFRYLILMREGGIYADVDILLETNLDQFISPSLSFFAPRDVVAEFAGEPFCLWNGLIGASPGHPFIVRAVERLVNLILDRADVFDMERDLCRGDRHGHGQRLPLPNHGFFLDMWKVRLQTLLLLSGPCGLGVAVNEALGKSSLEKIDTGWMGLDDLEFGGKRDHGDALIMVVDKYDIGSFRISDPERSTIVASTDLSGVEKKAREVSNPTAAELVRQQHRKRKELTHYSSSNKGNFVWGSSGVYTNKLVTNERITLDTSYEA